MSFSHVLTAIPTPYPLHVLHIIIITICPPFVRFYPPLTLTKDPTAIYLVVALSQQRVPLLLLLEAVPATVHSRHLQIDWLAISIRCRCQLWINEALLLIVAVVNPVLCVMVLMLLVLMQLIRSILLLLLANRDPGRSSRRNGQHSSGGHVCGRRRPLVQR